MVGGGAGVVVLTWGREDAAVTFGPGIALVMILVGVVLLLGARRYMACGVGEEGIVFRSFARRRERQGSWRVCLPWKEMVEIRRYEKHNLLVWRKGAVPEKEWVYFVMKDQTIEVSSDGADAWLFDDGFAEFWREVFEEAKRREIPAGVMFTEEERPGGYPKGLAVGGLRQYRKRGAGVVGGKA